MIEIDEYFYTTDRKFRGRVSVEHFPIDPREWSNLGRMICQHRNYDLGDKHDLNLEDCNDWNEVREVIEAAGGVLILPLGLYDHSGISMYIGNSHDRWDGGQVGFIYVTQEDLDREELTIEKAEEILRSEVKTYSAYLTGNIYRFDVWQEVSACSCGECKEWEAVECNSDYLDHREAEKDMEDLLNKFEPEVVKQ